jgi:hypothetical protein
MKPEPFFDRDSSANLIGQAKANRAKYLRDMFSSYSSKKLARAVAFIGLISLVAVGFTAWRWRKLAAVMGHSNIFVHQRTQWRNSRQRHAHAPPVGGGARCAGHRPSFQCSLSAKGYSWFWPKIKAALVSKHHWLVIACDSCDSVVDLDLRVKPRDPEASIRVALHDVRCPRCNRHGRPLIALARHPSI